MSTQEKESTLTRLAEFHYTTEQNIRAWYSHGGVVLKWKWILFQNKVVMTWVV